MATLKELTADVKRLEALVTALEKENEILSGDKAELEKKLESQKRHASVLRKELNAVENKPAGSSKAVQH